MKNSIKLLEETTKIIPLPQIGLATLDKSHTWNRTGEDTCSSPDQDVTSRQELVSQS